MSSNTTNANINMNSEPEKGSEHFLDEYSSHCPNAETLQAMENAINGVNMSRRFHSVEELMEYLNS